MKPERPEFENPSAHLSAVVAAVKKAAALQVRRYRGFGRIRSREKALNDFVTAVDTRSQQILVGELSRAYKSYGFLGEEDGLLRSGKRCWVIDPLDGTTNYMHKLPVFSISVALVENDRPLLGVVHDPLRQEWFRAVRGSGSFLNNRRIRVAATKTLKGSFLATGFPYRCRDRFDAYHESFRRLFLLSGCARRLGSAALDLCYVAAGRFDGFWEIGLKEWDLAAGWLIVKEAGGLITDFKGGGGFYHGGDTLAAAPAVHRRMLSILRGVRGLSVAKRAAARV